MSSDRSSDPFLGALHSSMAQLTDHLRPHLLDYDRLRSHIKRIAFYQQPHASSTPPSPTSHLTVPTPPSTQPSPDKAKRHHHLFWSELRRQVDLMAAVYHREEKDIRRTLQHLHASPLTPPAARLLFHHIASACTTPLPLPPDPSTLHQLIAVCKSLTSLTHYLTLCYLILWHAISKYNKHTHSTADQRQLASFPSSPFAPAPRLASLLTRAQTLLAPYTPTPTPPSSFLSQPPSALPPAVGCPVCLNPLSVAVHGTCHALCFHCAVRQPGFGALCGKCRREEEMGWDNVEVGEWVRKVSHVTLGPSPPPPHHPSVKRERGEEEEGEEVGTSASGRKVRKLTVKVGDVELSSLGPPPHLPFPPSPLSASSYASDCSTTSSQYLTPTTTTSSAYQQPHLPPSPGPNASPTASSAFDHFFALHYRPKRGQGVSCHQCKTNKDPSTLLFCGNREEKGVRRRRCRKKYCQSCLKRTYPLEVLMRQEGRGEWHCPSCVGQCCCAACQRKETGTPSPGGGQGDGEEGEGGEGGRKANGSPPVMSLAPPPTKREHQQQPHSAQPHCHSHFDLDAELNRAGDGNHRLVRSRSSPPYPQQLSLGGNGGGASSPGYFHHHQALPPLEPLSSPISPDSIAHSIAHSSPTFSAVDHSAIDWDPIPPHHHSSSKASTLPAHLLTRPPHLSVRPIMPPNSVLAAINSAPIHPLSTYPRPTFTYTGQGGGLGREGEITPPFFAGDDGSSRRGSTTADDASRRQWGVGGYEGREEKEGGGRGSMLSHGGQPRCGGGGGGEGDFGLLTDSFLSLPSLTSSPTSSSLGGVWAYPDDMGLGGSFAGGELGGIAGGGMELRREDGQQSMYGKGEGGLRHHERDAVDHELFAP